MKEPIAEVIESLGRQILSVADNFPATFLHQNGIPDKDTKVRRVFFRANLLALARHVEALAESIEP